MAGSELKSKRLADAAIDYRKRADTSRKFGNEVTRKKVSKLEKLRKQFAQQIANLKAEGVDVDVTLPELAADPEIVAAAAATKAAAAPAATA